MAAEQGRSIVSADDVKESSLPKVSRSRRWVWVLAVALILAIWPAYQAARAYKTSGFRQKCLQARDQEDWRFMRQTAEEWAEWNPEDGAPWWFAAEASQELDELDDLAFFLGHVPESDPKVLFALIEKANLEWTALNRPLDGLKTSEKIIAMDPRVLEIHSRIISFFAMNLQRPELIAAIDRAIDAGAEPRESYAYLLLADMLSFTNGSDLNSRWLASSPDEVRFKIGLGVHTAMKLAMSVDGARTDDSIALDEEASRQLQFFLEAAPHDSTLLTYLMYRAYQAADVDRVGELLKQVDGSAANDHMVWVFRAWYHTTYDELEDAEASINEALRLHPISPLAHHEYANLLRRKQSPDVELHQRLAAEGRELRSQLLRLPTVVDLDVEMLNRIRQYAVDCNATRIAETLKKRLTPRRSSALR
ncbi:MAG: hypothetical protein WAO83_07295 [Fuerstiella sp.]